MQAAQDDLASHAAKPIRQRKGAFGKRKVNGNAHQFWQGRMRRSAVEQILIPIFHHPMRRRGGGKAGQSKRRRKHMLAEAGVCVLWIKGIDQQSIAG